MPQKTKQKQRKCVLGLDLLQAGQSGELLPAGDGAVRLRQRELALPGPVAPGKSGTCRMAAFRSVISLALHQICPPLMHKEGGEALGPPKRFPVPSSRPEFLSTSDPLSPPPPPPPGSFYRSPGGEGAGAQWHSV